MTPAEQIAAWADRLRDISAMGMHFARSPYDEHHYHTIQDIAMAMLDLLETTGQAREVGRPTYAQLLAAFRRGYERLLAWPNERIEPFQIGRLLWMINWVAREVGRPTYESEWLARMVERHVPVFEHYERTGEVILPPAG